jgi:4-diphosphocytidyl-2-C-methyl-D-erythritol kinase
VAKALAMLPRPDALDITLEKNLPVAAGLGGGSADAGAVFRLIERLHGLPNDWQDRAAQLGADVPACVESHTCIGLGTGTELETADDSLAGTPVLLVNPRIPLSTGPVFKAWDGVDRGPLQAGTAREIAEYGRNDLREPAITICPQIADVLGELARDRAWKVEMSGSGATCFALYSMTSERDEAAHRIAQAHPDWWQMKGKLRR